MNDWIGLGVIGFILLCAIAGLWALSRPYNLTTAEFEKRAHESRGMMATGLMGLQKFLDPAMQKAVEAQEDLKEGKYDGEQGSGEPPEPGQSDDSDLNNV